VLVELAVDDAAAFVLSPVAVRVARQPVNVNSPRTTVSLKGENPVINP